jgi:hypothetical protein
MIGVILSTNELVSYCFTEEHHGTVQLQHVFASERDSTRAFISPYCRLDRDTLSADGRKQSSRNALILQLNDISRL